MIAPPRTSTDARMLGALAERAGAVSDRAQQRQPVLPPHPICPNCGNVSISQSDIDWKPPVRNSTPVPTSRTLTVFSIAPNRFLIAPEARMKGPMATADMAKGAKAV